MKQQCFRSTIFHTAFKYSLDDDTLIPIRIAGGVEEGVQADGFRGSAECCATDVFHALQDLVIR